jgi:2-iminoacetate synthase ThiH
VNILPAESMSVIFLRLPSRDDMCAAQSATTIFITVDCVLHVSAFVRSNHQAIKNIMYICYVFIYLSNFCVVVCIVCV